MWQQHVDLLFAGSLLHAHAAVFADDHGVYAFRRVGAPLDALLAWVAGAGKVCEGGAEFPGEFGVEGATFLKYKVVECVGELACMSCANPFQTALL